ncbi:hypothetical protein Tco_0246554 [Tanacetum coccineum]
MLLTRLFTHIVSNFPELSDDRYILCDHDMHPLAPHYERNTRSDHGTKRCRQSNPSSSSNVLDHSFSHHIDENDDANDEESSQSNTPPPSQLINSLQNIGLIYGRYGVLTELEYGVLVFPGYGVLILFPSWSFVKCRHRYAVSSLMDTAYWMSEQ